MALLKGETINLDTMEVIKVEEPAKPAAEQKNEDTDTGVDDIDDKAEIEKQAQDEIDANKGEEGDKDEDESDEKKDESGDEGKKDEDEEKKEGDEVIEDIDSYLAQQYEEKYGIKDEDDLQATLAAIADVEEENATLKKELEEAKKGAKVTFDSEQEEKIFNFLKKYPIDKMGDGLIAAVKLGSMDIDNLSPRTALEEKFILEHEELTREEALAKFERDYKRKYTVKESDYDGPEDVQAEQKLRDIDLKSDAAKAKKFLAKQQQEVKSKATEKPANNEAVQTNEVIQESVRTNLAEIDEYIGELDQLTFSADDGQNAFNYKFSKEQKAQVRDALKNWVGNPVSYDKDGKVKGGFEVEASAIKAAAMLFYDDIIDKAFNAGLSQGEIKRADQIAGRKPHREAKTATGGANVQVSEEDQWQAALEAKKKAKTSKVYK